SMAVSREFARLHAAAAPPHEPRNLLRSCEYLYWPVGGVVVLAIIGASGLISHDWLKANVGTSADVSHAVALMGTSIGIHWPSLIYAGVLSGMQRQVPLNTILGIATTIRWAGAALALWLLQPTIQVFLWSQIAASAVQTLSLATAAWCYMPRG